LSLVVDEHREYLSDQPRISAFSRAIIEVVKPGDVVLDLGSGTRILGYWPVEQARSESIRLMTAEWSAWPGRSARQTALQDRVVFIKACPHRVELPEKVDVIVADQIGHFGFNAGLLEYFSDARERFLKPAAQWCHAVLNCWWRPSNPRRCGTRLSFGTIHRQDLTSVRRALWRQNTGYPCKFQPEALLGAPLRIIALDLAEVTASPFKMEGCAAISRNGCLHGIAGWFSAHLSPKVNMTNSPLAPDSINRRNIFFPIDRPVDVVKG
jgi:protein arginine N-methyltransferase 1